MRNMQDNLGMFLATVLACGDMSPVRFQTGQLRIRHSRKRKRHQVGKYSLKEWGKRPLQRYPYGSCRQGYHVGCEHV